MEHKTLRGGGGVPEAYSKIARAARSKGEYGDGGRTVVSRLILVSKFFCFAAIEVYMHAMVLVLLLHMPCLPKSSISPKTNKNKKCLLTLHIKLS